MSESMESSVARSRAPSTSTNKSSLPPAGSPANPRNPTQPSTRAQSPSSIQTVKDAEGDDHDKTQEGSQSRSSPPAWAEMKTKAGKDRKRLPLACIACRRKKIRCSGEKPACKHCLKARIPCVYKVTTRKAAPRTDYMAMLDKRLKRMEERVLKIIPKGEQPSIPRAILKPSAIAAAQPKQRARKRTMDDAFGSDLETPAGTNGTTTPKTDGPRPAGAKADEQEEHTLLTEGAQHLPPFAIQEHLCEVYFDYVYGQAYPLLHKPSFMRRLHAKKVPPVLLLTVAALAARFSDHPDLRTEPAFLRGEPFAKCAREIVLRRYDAPNIVILTCLILLSLNEFGSCQGGRSWMLSGMAHRMAYALQLHVDLNYDPTSQEHKRASERTSELSPTDREIRRRTMWACFVLDRFNASGTARPMFVSEKLLDLPLPLREDLYQMEIPGPTETLEGKVPHPVPQNQGLSSDTRSNMGVTAYTVRLVFLWGKFINYFNLTGRLEEKVPLWHKDSDFNALQKEIKAFKATLPAHLQYKDENLKIHAAENVANQFLYMHILYNQIMLFSHGFAFPTSAEFKLPRDAPPQFMSAARRIALDAAQSISMLMNEAMNHRTFVPFAGYCAFFSSTVHISCMFSKNAQLEATSKACLQSNIIYLTKMKRYWGMFNFMMQILQDLYKQHADAAAKGTVTPDIRPAPQGNFQYGDWFERYPHGVSRTDFQEPARDNRKEAGNDAAMGEKNDLKSAEEFFASMSPPSAAAARARAKARKKPNRGRSYESEQPAAPSRPLPDQNTAQQLSLRNVVSPNDTPLQRTPSIPSPQPQNMPAGVQVQAPAQFADRSRQTQPPSHIDLDAMGNFASMSVPPQMTPTALSNANMMAQLDQQLALGPYNSTLINASPSVASSDFQFNPISGNGDMTGMWDLDLSGFQDEFMADEPASAWFPPFNVNMPPEFGMMGQAVHGFGQGMPASAGGMMPGFMEPEGWMWDLPSAGGDAGNPNGGAPK